MGVFLELGFSWCLRTMSWDANCRNRHVKTGELHDYKNNYSVVIQTLCDTKTNLRDLFIGGSGIAILFPSSEPFHCTTSEMFLLQKIERWKMVPDTRCKIVLIIYVKICLVCIYTAGFKLHFFWLGNLYVWVAPNVYYMIGIYWWSNTTFLKWPLLNKWLPHGGRFIPCLPLSSPEALAVKLTSGVLYW